MQYLSPVVWGFFILKWHSAPFKGIKNCCAGVCQRLGAHSSSVELKTSEFQQRCIQFSPYWLNVHTKVHPYHLDLTIYIQMV